MRTWFLTLVAIFGFVPSASAAVIVIANYTTEEVTFSVAEPGEKPRKHTILAHHVVPIPVNGPADLKLPAEGKNATVRVDPSNAYVLIPDRETGLRIEGVELPGKPPERDARPELNPIPRNAVKIPVTLLVDDADPRVDMVWQAEIRKRFEAAAAILETQTGFRFEFAGFDTWKSDAKAKDIFTQLNTLEGAVKVKPGALAVGFTSQKLDDKEKEFGACRGMGASHIVMREWRPKAEPEKVEVLVRYLAISLGAVTSPDPGSAMRAKLGDGNALFSKYVIRLDPLNTLALNLLADQRRLGVVQLDAVPLPDRLRIYRVYSALLQAFPGEMLAIEYLNVLEKDVAKVVDPKNPGAGGKKEPLQLTDRAKRTEAIRVVVRAITERSKANSGPATLTGDELTAALLRTAAEAAQRLEEPERISAFLLGIGLALDDTNSLKNDPLTTSAIADVEAETERLERLATLGNPTLRNRRDLCRRFVAGCAAGELLTSIAAENGAIGRSLFDQHRPIGLSFPGLSAEFSGIAFARILRENPNAILKRMRDRFSAADIIPDTSGLRDGLGSDKFEDDFGGTNDERFRAVIAEIRKRIQALPVNKFEP